MAVYFQNTLYYIIGVTYVTMLYLRNLWKHVVCVHNLILTTSAYLYLQVYLYISTCEYITHFGTVGFNGIICYGICPGTEKPSNRICYFFHQIPSHTRQSSGEPLLIFSAPKLRCPAHDHNFIKTPLSTWNRTYRTKMEWLKHFIGPLSHIRYPIRGNRTRLLGSRIPTVSFAMGANTEVRFLFPTRNVCKKSFYGWMTS